MMRSVFATWDVFSKLQQVARSMFYFNVTYIYLPVHEQRDQKKYLLSRY